MYRSQECSMGLQRGQLSAGLKGRSNCKCKGLPTWDIDGIPKKGEFSFSFYSFFIIKVFCLRTSCLHIYYVLIKCNPSSLTSNSSCFPSPQLHVLFYFYVFLMHWVSFVLLYVYGCRSVCWSMYSLLELHPWRKQTLPPAAVHCS